MSPIASLTCGRTFFFMKTLLFACFAASVLVGCASNQGGTAGYSDTYSGRERQLPQLVEMISVAEPTDSTRKAPKCCQQQDLTPTSTVSERPSPTSSSALGL